MSHISVGCNFAAIVGLVLEPHLNVWKNHMSHISVGCNFAAIVGLVLEPHLNVWKVGFNIALVSILCSGMFGSFVNNVVHTWAIPVKGLVYVAILKLLLIAIAIFMGGIFLGDTLYLRSMVEATIVSIGFYTVMWGKSKEEISEECVDSNFIPVIISQKG